MRRLLLPLVLAASCGVIDEKGAPGWQTEEPDSRIPKDGDQSPSDPSAPGDPVTPSNPSDPIALNNSNSPEVQTPPILPASCDGKRIVEVRGGEIWEVSMNGSQRMLHSFDVFEGTTAYIPYSLRGGAGEFSGFVATIPTEDDPLEPAQWASNRYKTEVVVLNGQGQRVLHEEFDFRIHPDLFVAENGDIAMGLRNGGESYVVRADGTKVLLGSHIPIMHPIDGHVLVTDSRSRGAWYNLANGQVAPLSATPGHIHAVHRTNDRIFYESTDGRFVVETPSSVRSVAMPSSTTYLTAELFSPNERFVLSTDDQNKNWRIDLESEPLDVVPVTLEAGILSEWSSQPSVRDDGAIVAARGAGSGVIQAVISSDLGATWSPIGTPIQTSDDGFFPSISQLHAGDSVLLTEVKVGYGYYLESIQALRSGEPVLETHAHGIYTGGAYGLNGRLELAQDGGCAVLWRLTEPEETFMSGVPELSAIDFSTGELHVLRTSNEPTFFRFIE